MMRSTHIRSYLPILAVALATAMTGTASADAPPFSATIDITGGLAITVGQTTTLTATWSTNRDVTRYQWYVDGVGQGVVSIAGASSGSPTFDFTPAAAGNYVISFRIWHHMQLDRDAAASVTVVVTEIVWQGLGVGYWKNHTEDWPPTGYSPSQTVGSVFVQSALYDLDEYTLLDILEAEETGGGPTLAEKAIILLRQAIAGVLNASHPDINYQFSPASVIAAVNAALAAGDADDMETLKDILEANNELGL